MTVEQLLGSLSSDEITYWMAFFKLEEEDREHERMKSEVKNSVRW